MHILDFYIHNTKKIKENINITLFLSLIIDNNVYSYNLINNKLYSNIELLKSCNNVDKYIFYMNYFPNIIKHITSYNADCIIKNCIEKQNIEFLESTNFKILLKRFDFGKTCTNEIITYITKYCAYFNKYDFFLEIHKKKNIFPNKISFDMVNSFINYSAFYGRIHILEDIYEKKNNRKFTYFTKKEMKDIYTYHNQVTLYTARGGEVETLKWLLSNNIVTILNPYLYIAAIKNNCKDFIEYLYSKHISWESQDVCGFALSSQSESTELFYWFYERGGEITKRCLTYASKYDNVSLIKFILSKNTINLRIDEMIINVCIQYNSIKIFKWLYNNSLLRSYENSCIYLSFLNGKIDLCIYFLNILESHYKENPQLLKDGLTDLFKSTINIYIDFDNYDFRTKKQQIQYTNECKKKILDRKILFLEKVLPKFNYIKNQLDSYSILNSRIGQNVNVCKRELKLYLQYDFINNNEFILLFDAFKKKNIRIYL